MSLTTLEAQAALFEYFIQTANLCKIAATWLQFDNNTQQRTYIRRVLRSAGVQIELQGQMLPKSKYYSEILVVSALSALMNQTTGLKKSIF